MTELISGCKKLNRKAQRKMVDHLSPFLFAICRRYAKNHEDAKDLLQESLILIFNNIEKCSAKTEIPFKSWCRRIAINTILGKKRKKTFSTRQVEENDFVKPITPAIDSQLHVEDILALLNQLPENQRLVFNLSIIDGYSHKEIAELLNVKESSSRTFLTRARRSMQLLIHQQEIR
ncbi:MAG: RNA polymerase sigma factor [Bacteroidota bacterium]